jgi:hypothetical protein
LPPEMVDNAQWHGVVGGEKAAIEPQDTELQRKAQAMVIPAAALDLDLVRGGEGPVPRQFFIAGIRWQAERRTRPPPCGHRRALIRRH